MSDEVKLLPCVTHAFLQFADGTKLSIDFKDRQTIDEALSSLRIAATSEPRPPIGTDEVVETQGLGAIPGSREPDPSCTGSGPSGFDPERWQSIETAKVGELVLLWQRAWRHPYIGKVIDPDAGTVWLESPDYGKGDLQAFADCWTPLQSPPERTEA